MGSKEMIKAMNKLQSQSTSNPCSISQKATIAALDGDHDFIKERNAEFQARRDMVIALIQDIDGLECIKPQGAFYLFVDCQKLVGKKTPSDQIINDDVDLCSYLLEDAHVATVPGTAFGAKNYLRLSYATSKEKLQEAFKKIKEAINSLK